MRLPLRRPVGALPEEEVKQLPERAQDYIARLETKFMLNVIRLEHHLRSDD
jgi:hypothetical protein